MSAIGAFSYFNYNQSAYASQNAVADTDWEPESDLEIAIHTLALRYGRYQRFSAYYDGNHDLRIAIEKMRNTFGYFFQEFADNLCPTVIDSFVERLEVIGFDLESKKNQGVKVKMPVSSVAFQPKIPAQPTQPTTKPANSNGNSNAPAAPEISPSPYKQDTLQPDTITLPSQKDTIADIAWDLWRQCRMKEVQNQIHLEAAICGDSYLVVWPNPKDPSGICAYPQMASQFYIEDDPNNPNYPIYAAKVWYEKKRLRVTLYYSDRIEKYISTKGRNQPKKDEDFEHYNAITDEVSDEYPNGKPESWPLPNTFGRVPAFRFSNKSRMGGIGKSELRDVIPLQDALNKAMMDLMVAMEYAALRQRWGTGLEMPKDPMTGEPLETFESGVDRMIYSANENTKFGEFSAADLQSFTTTQDSFRMEIARVSRTPIHYFSMQTGNAPSGAALRSIEKPLVAKCEFAQTSFGDVWEDVTEFMLLIAKEIEKLGTTQLESQWKPAETKNELDELQSAVLKKEIGITNRQIQSELGYTQQEIERMEIESAAQTSADNQQHLQDTMTAFDRGNNFGAKSNF